MDWPVEEGTKVVCGSQRSEDTDLKPRWTGCGFLISARNCLKIQNARGVAGLSQEVVNTCYARHVSRKPRALDEVSQGGLASRLMAGLGNWQDEIIRPLKTWFYDERYVWGPWVENVGTQRWSVLFERLVFWFVCLILPGWSHSLTHKGPSEKSRATKHSIWLHRSLQWLWARPQFTRSFKGPNVKVVNRFKLEKCAWVCVHQGVFSFCTSWGHRSAWVTTWIIVSSRVPGEDAEPTALSQLAGPPALQILLYSPL